MHTATRITLIFIRQIVFGISYVYGTIYIGLPLFNIQIDTRKEKIPLFGFENLFRK